MRLDSHNTHDNELNTLGSRSDPVFSYTGGGGLKKSAKTTKTIGGMRKQKCVCVGGLQAEGDEGFGGRRAKRRKNAAEEIATVKITGTR